MTQSCSGHMPAELFCCRERIQQGLRPDGEHLDRRPVPGVPPHSSSLSTSRLLAAAQGTGVMAPPPARHPSQEAGGLPGSLNGGGSGGTFDRLPGRGPCHGHPPAV